MERDYQIASIAKTASKKIRALIRSTKFRSPDVALYPYKSTIRPCMEYCCYVWAGAPSCCQISNKNESIQLFVLQLLPLSSPWLIVET